MYSKIYIKILKYIILLSFLARLYTFGWVFIMFILFVFPLYAALFFLSNRLILENFKKNSYFTFLFYSSCITFMLPWLFYPDYGDIGGKIAFFGLITTNTSLLEYISCICWILNLIIIAMQFISGTVIFIDGIITKDSKYIINKTSNASHIFTSILGLCGVVFLYKFMFYFNIFSPLF